jgi:long-subunit fatty acid transport protein
VLLLSASWAAAGGLDRTGQPIAVIFEEGTYGELSFGLTSPTVEGTFAGTGAASGDVGESFATTVLSFKTDVTEQLSVAVILEEPFGADVSYADAEPGYPLGGSEATYNSASATVLGRYRFDENFSVHGGVRFIQTSADVRVSSFQAADSGYIYDASFADDRDVGYVLGAAYERPDIALRVALTYSSETSFANDSDYDLALVTPLGPIPFEGGGAIPEYTLPQSVNLDFQTGIAPGTLLFGSVRWADWSSTEINLLVPTAPADSPLAAPLGTVGATLNPVVNYPDDYFTYTIGVGRQITDRLSGAVSVIYEPGITTQFDPGEAVLGSTGGSNLSPADGQLAVLLASSYQFTDNLEVSGGVRFARLGDVSTRLIGAEFEDNTAVSVGLRVGYRF